MAKSKSAGIGHNSEPLTDEERADLIAYYGDRIRKQQRTADEAKAAYDSERTEVNSLFALVRGDLQISRKEFEAVLAAQDMTEAEFRHAENKRASLYALAGLPVGAQLELFGAGDTADEQEQAFLNGKRAGQRGDDPTPPDHVSPILVPDWQRGWSAGQQVLYGSMERARAIIDARKAPAPEPMEPDEEPVDDLDPENVAKQARALKKSGWTEPTPEEAEFA